MFQANISIQPLKITLSLKATFYPAKACGDQMKVMDSQKSCSSSHVLRCKSRFPVFEKTHIDGLVVFPGIYVKLCMFGGGDYKVCGKPSNHAGEGYRGERKSCCGVPLGGSYDYPCLLAATEKNIKPWIRNNR